jgi:class 3 adenylate cyclase
LRAQRDPGQHVRGRGRRDRCRIEASMRCARCQTELTAGTTACPHCDGERRCHACGAGCSAAASYCSQCAAPLRPERAEWRQISVLFCDLVDAAEFARRLDPEDWCEVLRAHQAQCARAVAAQGGEIAQYLGEGVLAYFGFPVAHEDDAARAVAAGLLIRAAAVSVKAAGRREDARRVRIGIHTGPVVVGEMGGVGRREQLAVGDTLNLAARVHATAPVNSVLVSETTRLLLRDGFELRPFGQTELRGFEQRMPLFEVLARSRSLAPRRARPLQTLFGREAELTTLTQHWRRASEGQTGGVILLGEQGSGKSALLRALGHQVERDGGRWLSCYCGPQFQNSALYPLLEMLERELPEIVPAGLVAVQAGGRDSLVPGLARDSVPPSPARDSVPPTAARESFAPAAPAAISGRSSAAGSDEARRLRRQHFESLKKQLLRLSEQQPIMLSLEDAQFCDPSLLEWLARLGGPSGRLLLVITSRPPAAPELLGLCAHTLTLARLEDAPARRLIVSVAAPQIPSEALLTELLDKADGVPLYLEELTKAAFESVGESPASAGLAAIPIGLRDSLMARLDRLGEVKSLLQLAATLGRSFDFALLLALSGADEPELRAQLAQLTAAELLIEQAGPTQAHFAFRHALLHEAAYGSLLRRTRQEHHAAVVDTLLQRFPQLAAAQPELVAQHCEAAGRAGDAVDQLELAVGQALQRAANLEAERSAHRALALLSSLPESLSRDEREVRLRTQLGAAMSALHGAADPGAEANYVRAHALCQKLGRLPLPVLYGVWSASLVRGDLARTADLAEHFERLTARLAEPAARALAGFALGTRAFYLGRFAAGRELLREALAQAESESGSARNSIESVMYGMIYLIFCEAALGRVESAVQTWQRAMARAERSAHPLATLIALHGGQVLALDFTGELMLATKLAEQQRELAREHEFAFFEVLAEIHLGGLAVRFDPAADGVKAMRLAALRLREMGNWIAYPYAQKCLAESLLGMGRAAEAAAVVADALQFCAGKLAEVYLPSLLWLRGRAAAMQRQVGAAERAFRDALGLLSQTEAAHGRLDISLDLAQLMAASGRAAEARALLERAIGDDVGDAYPTPVRRAAREMLGRMPG